MWLQNSYDTNTLDTVFQGDLFLKRTFQKFTVPFLVNLKKLQEKSFLVKTMSILWHSNFVIGLN